mgnify:CR=1 FL=1|tara:strand:- start:765 stop:1301 length:537 start_codon:yes stop_codon:yes gene_type:complete
MDINLGRIFHININVVDIDRSVSFYEGLGFKKLYDFELDPETVRQTCAAFGSPPNPHRGVFMSLGDTPTATILDLVQWYDPPTGGQVYPTLTNVGIPRMAFHVDNPMEVYEELMRRGTEFLGPIGGGSPPGGAPNQAVVFAFRDPDGNVLEVLSGVDYMARPLAQESAAAGGGQIGQE